MFPVDRLYSGTMDSLERLVTLGERMGYTGDVLQKFVRETQKEEREDRLLTREDQKQKDEREAQRQREEMEHIERLRRLEIEAEARRMEAQAQAEGRHQEDGDNRPEHGTANAPRLPLFNEDKDSLDAYLGRFERYAEGQRWPRGNWATNLSALLSGKALEVYYRLAQVDVTDYDVLKDALLNRFQLTEEGYRSRFFTSRAEVGESAAQFLTRLGSYLQHWVRLSRTEATYEGLSTLFIREAFFEACHRDLQTFLRERRVRGLADVEDAVDSFIRAHGGGISGSGVSNRKTTVRAAANGKSQPNAASHITCYKCGKQGHYKRECRMGGPATSGPTRPGNLARAQERPLNTPGFTCYLCGRPGHIARDCRRFDKPPPHVTAMASGEGSASSACTCQAQHPACFITSLGEAVEEYDQDTIVDRGVTYPVCHQRCSKPIPGRRCCKLPTAFGLLNNHRVEAMRDSGCSGVVVKTELVRPTQYTGRYRLCLMIDGTARKVPVAVVAIDCPYYTGEAEAMVMRTPVYDLIIGNIPGVRGASDPDPDWQPTSLEQSETPEEVGAVTTRGQASKRDKPVRPLIVPEITIPATEKQRDFAKQQRDDITLKGIWKHVVDGTSKPRRTRTAETEFAQRAGILYRIHRQRKGTQVVVTKQVALPQDRRPACLRLAHEAILGGHMGVQKTLNRILAQFYWPGMQGDVSRFCKSCDICQRTIPKGRVTKVPLVEMPTVGIPFQRVAVDLVGPIWPATDRGHQYILTIVDYATRYPEAVPLMKIDTQTVAEALFEVYSRVGFPDEVLTDQGTQFTSAMMREVGRLISIRQLTTTPYHPMCNGLVERFNGTLKTILRRLSKERPCDWDRYLPAVLFAYREVPQESTHFSPFELLYGRHVRGPMTILKELWVKERNNTQEAVTTSYQYVLELRDKIADTCRLAREELQKASHRYKRHFDKKTRPRQLHPGDWALILLPTDHNKLLMQWKGPFKVLQQISKVDYSLELKGKPRTFHLNMLKQYIPRTSKDPSDNQTVNMCASVFEVTASAIVEEGEVDEEQLTELFNPGSGETYRDVHYDPTLTPVQRQELEQLVAEYQEIFTDRPYATTLEEHSIELTTEEPIRQKPYPVPYAMREAVQKEIKAMLDYDVIERTDSPYASPIVLVRKKDGAIRFCIDFRRLNRITIFNGEPMPTAGDIFTKLRQDHYLTKLDLAKGYWQIPMRQEDRAKTAFVTPEGHYQFKRMPFGLVNATATFNRLMRKVLCHVPFADSCVDDVLAHTPDWAEHLNTLRKIFKIFRRVHLTVRPTKCCLGFRELDFIGHRIGGGSIYPQSEKVTQILAAKPPTTKREVRSFLGLVGYYRDFIPQFSTIATPLTELTRKHYANQVDWKPHHQAAFEQLKTATTQEPVLRMPDFARPFILQTDASEHGAGAALLQEYGGVKHPLAYFSRKFSSTERAYSVIEKECLALVWGVRKFQAYLYGVEFSLETDHEPLVFIDTAKYTNSRIMRWALYLQNYRFSIKAVKGKDNVIADYLSRVITNGTV